MSFVSPEFLIFFVIVTTIYFLTGYRWRWFFLLVASYFFYAYWNTGYIVLIIFSTFIDYFAARWIDRTPEADKARRRALLAVSLSVNLGVLFIFKYFNFFSDSAGLFFQSIGLNYAPGTLNVLLPVGISFYTFQSMSYTIDVYRGRIKPEEHAGIFATFIAFFPQLVAGPIERAQNMLPQFREKFDFDYERIVSGLRLILWGVFKKVVIADRVAIYVNAVYNNTGDYQGWPLLIATFFFAFQIYCDFSGYSDIAIGTARVMGFRLMDNFRQPYLATSIRDFWRRWHISLSTWFRDYLYIPLGGSRVSLGRNLVNLMIVFVVSGLWHGANWTFVVWGALHGLFIVIETVIARFTPAGRTLSAPLKAGQIVLTFVLVCLAWVFFRANSITDAGYILSNLFILGDASLSALAAPFASGLLPAETEFMLAFGLIALLLAADWFDAHYGLITRVGSSPVVVRWALYYTLAFAITFSFLYYTSDSQQFIYFQF